jgi:hypothetical protein
VPTASTPNSTRLLWQHWPPS